MSEMEQQYHKYSNLEDAIVGEINSARGNPSLWVSYLHEMMQQIKGDKYKHKKFGSITYPNAVETLQSAINHMTIMAPVGELKREAHLDRIARYEHARLYRVHTKDKKESMAKMHERMKLIANTFDHYAESFSFGFPEHREVVKDLIMREFARNPDVINIFSPDYVSVGVYIDKHPKKRLCTIFSFMGTDYSYKHGENIAKNRFDLPYGEFPSRYKALNREFTAVKVNGFKTVDIEYEFAIEGDKMIRLHRKFVGNKLRDEVGDVDMRNADDLVGEILGDKVHAEEHMKNVENEIIVQNISGQDEGAGMKPDRQG